MAEPRYAALLPDPEERTPAILLVEDEVLIRVVVADYLQECGFKIFEASTAGEAIRILEANNTIIDLVFSDVKMPGEMDGFGLSQWVKANRPRLPIILTSGDARKTDAARDLCDEVFMTKPYDLVHTVAQIRTMLDAQK